MMWRRRRFRFLLTLTPWLPLLSVALAAPAAAQPGKPFYFAGDERIELEVVADALTVERTTPGETAGEVRAALGLESTSARLTELEPGVWHVDLAPAAEPMARQRGLGEPGAHPPIDTGSAARPERENLLRRQRDLLDRALAQPATGWAYPALRNPRTGTPLLLTPRIIVAVEKAGDAAAVERRLPAGLRVVRPLRGEGQYLLALTAPRQQDPLEMAAALAGTAGVRWAEPDFIQGWRREATPDDPLFGDQWHLSNGGQGGGLAGADAELEDAWELETGDPGIVVAVIDDGVETGHPDLPIYSNPGEVADGVDNDGNGLVDDLQGWDFFSGDNDPDPCNSATCSAGVGSHGTAVAGVAAASGDDATGVTGACQGCSILPVRIANHATGAFTSNANIADAIDYAGEMADVLNNSWGGGSPSAAITSAISGAASNGRGGLGAPVFFSSGNSASGHVTLTLSGIPAGTWTFTWTFSKDALVTAGFDTAWLDEVVFQDGSVEGFEGCGSLPAGWSTGGSASWSLVDDETRASSGRGGHCAAKAGTIAASQATSISVTKSFASAGSLAYSIWPSSDRNTIDGEGPLVIDDLSGSPECFDHVELTAFDGMTTFGPFLRICGTWSNQGNPLADGTVSYPASLADSIAVGAATNFDSRGDYGQWQANVLDFVCHTNGGSLDVTTTDLMGGVGYDSGDYTDIFGGTSSSSPLCAGIAALMLSRDPGLTGAEVRSRMEDGTRKIGTVAYAGGRNDLYGFGAVSARKVMFPSCDDGAPAVLEILNETVTSGTETFEACDTVSAEDFEVDAGATAILEAGRRLVLVDGVQVAGDLVLRTVGTL